MITIRAWLEVTTPSAERMKGLPVGSKEFVITTTGEVDPLFEKVQVDGKAYPVERVGYTGPAGLISYRFILTPQQLAASELISVGMAVIEELGKQSHKE